MKRIAKAILARWLWVIIFTATPIGAYAQSVGATQPAQDAAAQFWVAFDTEVLSKLYARMSPAFRSINEERIFAENIGMMRIQLGGVGQARTLVGSQALTQMPNGQKGEFFYVRHKTRFPNGDAFQDVTLERHEGKWFVGFFTFAGAPQ